MESLGADLSVQDLIVVMVCVCMLNTCKFLCIDSYLNKAKIRTKERKEGESRRRERGKEE
jgi:hypothetical protein